MRQWRASSSSTPDHTLTRLRLDVAYKGTNLHGFARQKGDSVPTVAGKLETALSRFFRIEVPITCAGRTDAGVHARGQVISFDVPELPGDLGALVSSINKQVGPDVVVRNPLQVDDEFSARFSAKARAYKYTVSDEPFADPITRDFVWWVGQRLDLDDMNAAAQHLLGENDFASFCRRPNPDATLVRRLLKAHWSRVDGLVAFEIEANAFCHQMVRSIVGELVAVGLGKRRPDDVANTLAAKNRGVAAAIAPPHGLCLERVDY